MAHDLHIPRQPPGWQQLPPERQQPPQPQHPSPSVNGSPRYPQPDSPQYSQPQPPYPPTPPPEETRGAGKIGLMVRGGIVGLCGLFAIIGVASSGSPRSATATPARAATSATPVATMVAGVNQTVTLEHWDLTVTGVEQPGKTLPFASHGAPTDAAGTWVVVQVKMKNVGNQQGGVHVTDYQLRTPAGSTYPTSEKVEVNGYSQDRGGADVRGQVPPGDEVTLYLVFDVAPDTTGLQLQFNQDKGPLINLGI